MTTPNKKLKTCPNGHTFYKSSDCPVCPICEQEKKPTTDFLSLLSAPARRALVGEGIETLEQLAAFSEKEILQLHGMGSSSLPKLRASLAARGLAFKQ